MMELSLRRVNLKNKKGLLVAIDVALGVSTENSTEKDCQFLCRDKNGRIFVSDISLLTDPDHTMPSNCPDGCIYVDHGKIGMLVPIDQLAELYYIVGGDYE